MVDNIDNNPSSTAANDFNIGLMPLLLENAHATTLLSRVMNLVKEAVEHLNPNQTPVLTMDQPLSAIAKEIQWMCPDSFSNNKYVIIILKKKKKREREEKKKRENKKEKKEKI